MPGNVRVFISYAHEDADECKPLLTTLERLGVNAWIDKKELQPGDPHLRMIEAELAVCDIFIRVCSKHAHDSFWVGLERDAFLCLLADDFKQGFRNKRKLISVVVDHDYQPTPFELASIYIVASDPSGETWEDQLRKALEAEPEICECQDQDATASLDKLPTSAQISLFRDVDEEYRQWVDAHANGYILNCERQPRARYLLLHRTNCGWIKRPIVNGDRLTAAYIKVCSDDFVNLEEWAKQTTGGDVRRCGLCKP